MLRAIGVSHMVVPCISSLLQMWTQKFGFTPISAAERDALEDQIVMMDPATTFLVKKSICGYCRPPVFPVVTAATL